ncbi:ZN829 protein, partial [Rhinopomastus cyanomelas]|nr:ZN829 protein [Rhinopomastus cyanomelas]
ETLRWTVVQQLDPPTTTAAGGRCGGKGGPAASGGGAFSSLRSLVVLQKGYECSDCGKSFSCSSHFSKHRRTHTG